MSTELREAIEAAIQTHDDGEGAPIGPVIQSVATEFGIATTLSRMLDLYRRGEIYTTGGARVRVTHERNVVADGGWRHTFEPDSGAEPADPDPFTLTAMGSVAQPDPPDPETCHPDCLLGRHVEVDYGSGTRAGEIYKIVDRNDERGRWIHLKPGSGPTAQVDPSCHDITLLGRGDPSE